MPSHMCMSLAGSLPGDAKRVGDDRPGNSGSDQSIDLRGDQLLGLTPSLHQLVRANEPFRVGVGACPPRRR